MNYTCCFSGHCILSEIEISALRRDLTKRVDALLDRGVHTFITGGAIGFDMLVADILVDKKNSGTNLCFVLAIPCPDHTKNWSGENKAHFMMLLEQADEIQYVSKEYHEGCMKTRNFYMVDRSAYCICASRKARSGSAQTMNYARQRGKRVTNILQERG